MTLSYGINKVAVRIKRWAVSRRWWVLMLWQLLWSIVHLRSHGYGWHYFVSGARILFSSNGLNLYSTNAELQIGPLTLVAVAPFAFAPRQIGQASALAAMTILGLVLLRQIESLYRSGRAVEASGPATHHPSGPRRDDGDTSAVRFLLVGLCVIPVWSELAVRFAHFDDVLALLCAVIAMRLLKRSRWDLWPALLLGLSVDCKPWAAVFLPLLWLAPPGRRWLSVTVGVLSVAVAWLPFYIADPSSLSAVSFKIPVADASVIHLFGIVGGTPAWSRPAQLLTGAALASVAIYRGRWPAVLFVGICMRMLLDPAIKSYYDAGLVIGAGICDLLLTGSILPWITLGALTMVYAPSYLLYSWPTAQAVLRLLYLATAPFLVLTLKDHHVQSEAQSGRWLGSSRRSPPRSCELDDPEPDAEPSIVSDAKFKEI